MINFGLEEEGRRKNNSNCLFVGDFYEGLLEDIRKSPRSILFGNSGVGKSYFRAYYLTRILNPHLFPPLPPDYYIN